MRSDSQQAWQSGDPPQSSRGTTVCHVEDMSASGRSTCCGAAVKVLDWFQGSRSPQPAIPTPRPRSVAPSTPEQVAAHLFRFTRWR
jgi:hypothetical protein